MQAATAGGWALRRPAQDVVLPVLGRVRPLLFSEKPTGCGLPAPELSRWRQLACVRMTRPASRAPFAVDSRCLPLVSSTAKGSACRTPDACAMDASWDQNLGPLRYSGARFAKSAANADASNGSRCSGQAPPIPGAGHSDRDSPCSALPQPTGLTAKLTGGNSAHP